MRNARATGGFLASVGLHRAPLRAWALYDAAQSASAAIIITAIFPTFYAEVAAAGSDRATERYALTTTLSLVTVALASPVLGALADAHAWRKRLLAAFLALGCAASAGMFFIGPGDWRLASVLFFLVNLGGSGSFVFYDALLPHIARHDELDRVSTSGYALGYLGGGLLLAANLAWIRFPAAFGLPHGDDLPAAAATLPVRLGFVAVAVWWVLFSIPLFRRVPEPPPLVAERSATPVRDALRQLRLTLGRLRQHRQALLFLLAFLLYNDGVLTIIRMATLYGTEIGLARDALIGTVLVVNFIGVPGAFAFGKLAASLGPKRSIYLALGVFILCTWIGYRMTTAREFFAIGVLIGAVLGGTQALSRSLFARMVPASRSAEFFAFFAVTEKFAGILGPALFTVMIATTGSSRHAVLALLVFFVAGGALLQRVDVARGMREAQAFAPDAEGSRDAGGASA